MKSNVLKISRDAGSLAKILCETQKTATYAELDAKQALRTRLVAEELVGMLKGLSDNFSGEFWIEQEDLAFKFYTQIIIIKFSLFV